MIHVESAGGSTGTAELIKRSLEELSNVKPTLALIENICFSAAYTIVAGADWIVAPAAAEIGSIGILMKIERQEKVQTLTNNNLERAVTFELFYKGSEKVMRHYLANELTAEERDMINRHLGLYYKELCSDISTARNLPLEKSHEWAEGKIFYGHQALEQGLIDEIGGFPEVKAHFKKIFSSNDASADLTLSFSLIP